MNNTIVVYQSKYGHTKQYAKWIADKLACECIELKDCSIKELEVYDWLIYGGGVYASHVAGLAKIKSVLHPKVVVFTVGLSDPMETDYTEMDQNINDMRNVQTIFHFRGGLDYRHLTMPHRIIINMIKKIKAKPGEPTESHHEVAKLITEHGETMDFSNQANIQPLVQYLSKCDIA